MKYLVLARIPFVLMVLLAAFGLLYVNIARLRR